MQFSVDRRRYGSLAYSEHIENQHMHITFDGGSFEASSSTFTYSRQGAFNISAPASGSSRLWIGGEVSSPFGAGSSARKAPSSDELFRKMNAVTEKLRREQGWPSSKGDEHDFSKLVKAHKPMSNSDKQKCIDYRNRICHQQTLTDDESREFDDLLNRLLWT
ncbi:hypothetical protein GUITHDRAFT_100483 [Guillardia theta CCMP2712]|uniref:Uncharacterized protein n=1 Tax=Guillardia theta (strain CCMP2712) TaxID=905079 RepID=L1K0W0_GUITC|nr:hypothetical protein GUITHDRAFT_100483 [Guillardia theta CCMP2712]EKX54237.1 hypothetical protein GUITHDRAFT_100483 [Guillardia theta CCMP2712]|eukprot:XP_005841217.1 hypothetical protein GUITHDRAFT_100483 [Guillardia theta CCMP2712]